MLNLLEAGNIKIMKEGLVLYGTVYKIKDHDFISLKIKQWIKLTQLKKRAHT
jgi:hypothetical protein